MLAQLLKVSGGALVVCMAIYPLVNPPKQKPSLDINGNAEADNSTMVEANSPATQSVLPDFAAITNVKAKKQAFFDYLTPYVKQINQDIAQSRHFIQSLSDFPTEQTAKTKLANLMQTFRVKDNSDFAWVKAKLLNRVDQLPIELVLMQAANESAWGTSRFALQANNLFGQWCFSPGCGVVPEGRPEGERYEVKKFDHPAASINSYFLNLNTNQAYHDLRIVRRTLRAMGQELDPIILAEGLLAYSTRREAYVEEIQQMITVNARYIAK